MSCDTMKQSCSDESSCSNPQKYTFLVSIFNIDGLYMCVNKISITEQLSNDPTTYLVGKYF